MDTLWPWLRTAATLLFGALPFVYVWRFPEQDGAPPLTYGNALHHVYFLLFGQPTFRYIDDVVLTVLNFVIPPFGLATVVDGVVRFSYLFSARRRAEPEWIELVSESLRNHIIVCGAGRVGYRLVLELQKLGRDVVVIEKRADSNFGGVLQGMNVPVLIDDARSPQALVKLNIAHAEAILCATDNDLTNINVALDARKLNPEIRVVLRLFDDDLVERVRDTFKAEAHSTSALAAPHFALSALDPRIIHSFHVGEHLMVVSRFVVNAPLMALNLSKLRDQFGGLTLSMKRGSAPEVLHPQGNTELKLGDELVVQCRYSEYVALRAHTGEARAPLSLVSGVQGALPS